VKSNIINLNRPRVFTTSESLIEEVRQSIFDDKSTYKDIAKRCSVSGSTIGNLAAGKTKWPRPTTLFPLLNALDLEMRIVKRGQQ
jgi:transcriptional regulator with XRE-family HTH domain